jgi:hypothetical protein
MKTPMAYPRRCAGCSAPYDSFVGHSQSTHVTLGAEDGGTSSPWLLSQPGRLMEMGCRMCGAIYRWDYFGPSADGRLGTVTEIMRGPVPGWSAEVAFTTMRDLPRERFADRQKAS